MSNNTQPSTDEATSLFGFMMGLRADPLKVLQSHFPDVDFGSEQPRNLSREHKGTPDEFTGFMVVYGFGDPLKHVVAVAFHMSANVAIAPPWANDYMTIERVYGVRPIVLALASEHAVEEILATQNGAKA